ncbi:hypothetical protein SEA_REINDEER_125 [Mycobacterium phage Reindeer]|uniref:Uncharacterized protein n=1 Tax=Mycobacterium phage Reindeer TaxID=2762283 RepID=A0A7G8LI44_9CAUD|nr:hypothetical protein J4U05_gp127 [Mycobacterium phage Reindeer]QNJ56916.1 hypothetical protein SEA_REINDEER_125 [Mycobacterium phage Reindeer]
MGADVQMTREAQPMTARDKVAEAISRQAEWEAVSIPYPKIERLADAAIGAHMEALSETGHVVVKLPEPTAQWAGGPEWRYGDSVVWTAPGGNVMVQNVEPGDLHPEQARMLGAWLLAAAAKAES